MRTFLGKTWEALRPPRDWGEFWQRAHTNRFFGWVILLWCAVFGLAFASLSWALQ